MTKMLGGAAYAQQGLFLLLTSPPHTNATLRVDAEECWTQMTNALKDVPGLPGSSGSSSQPSQFVDQFLMGEMRREYVPSSSFI